MRGSIHDCATEIKAANQSQLLLRHPRGGYQIIRASELSARNALDPRSKRYDDVIGVFNRQIAVTDIYEAAGEPPPGEAPATEAI